MSDDFLNVLQAFENHGPDNREEIVRSPLHYMGSKRASLKWILDLLPYDEKWVDVFGGSGAVTIARNPSKLDVFNDRHSGISAFFISIKENPDLLIEHIKTLPQSREIFTWCKDNIERTTHDHFLRGAMFYYLVQYSFAGCTRTFGRATKVICPLYTRVQSHLDLFDTISRRFQSVQVDNLDWRQVIKDYDDSNTVMYMDPPYFQSNVYKYGMSDAEHFELCTKIFGMKSFVALSGFDNPVYDKFDWDGKHEFQVSNRCATSAHSTEGENLDENSDYKSGKRTECLWIKEAY